MKKLAIVSTHAIQYNAPWFNLLAERKNIKLKVFYTWSQSWNSVKDKTFGKEIKWDIPLLDGYEYEFVKNISKNPGSHHFFGIDNPGLKKKLKSYQPDAILFFGWKFKSHLKAMRYFSGKVPVWFRGDSTLLDEKRGFKAKIRRFVLTCVYNYVDKAFYVGEASKAYFLKHGLKNNQLTKASHAIDNQRFAGSDNNYDKEALKWRKELGFRSDDIVIVFAGKLESKKQPEFLISAFENVKKVNSNSLQLLIVGNGPLENDLKAKYSDEVKFIPFQNQTKMPLVYRLGDVFCLPSKGPGETWGLAVNEAMASGKSVIVSDKVGCAQDLIIKNKTGFVFKHDNKEGLKNILVNLNKSSLELMGREANNKIKNYNFLNIVKAIENNLNEL